MKKIASVAALAEEVEELKALRTLLRKQVKATRGSLVIAEDAVREAMQKEYRSKQNTIEMEQGRLAAGPDFARMIAANILLELGKMLRK